VPERISLRRNGFQARFPFPRNNNPLLTCSTVSPAVGTFFSRIAPQWDLAIVSNLIVPYGVFSLKPPKFHASLPGLSFDAISGNELPPDLSLRFPLCPLE